MTEIQIYTNHYPMPVPGVVSRLIHDEAILVQAEQGKVRVLNEVGARIWTLADGTRSIQHIAELLCSEYQVDAAEAEADVLAFIGDLVARGLLQVVDQPASSIG